MRPPLPTELSLHASRDPISVQSERLDALLEQFGARSRAAARRYGLTAALAAILVVAFGVWGFRFETNTRVMPVPHAGAVPRRAPMVTYVIPVRPAD